jgi:hypothetical protein
MYKCKEKKVSEIKKIPATNVTGIFYV